MPVRVREGDAVSRGDLKGRCHREGQSQRLGAELGENVMVGIRARRVRGGREKTRNAW